MAFVNKDRADKAEERKDRTEVLKRSDPDYREDVMERKTERVPTERRSGRR